MKPTGRSSTPSPDGASAMLYPELFRSFERVRWSLEEDVPWELFDGGLLSEEQALTIKMNAITEWAALPATAMFLRDNQDDGDFCAFMSVWFFEEQKHALVLLEYLRRFRPDLLPSEAELQAVCFPFEPAPAMETLMLHFCGEIRLNHWYRCAAQWHGEPVIRLIYGLIARDEARHAGAYLKYMQRAVERGGDRVKAAFARTGLLMAAGGRSGKPMHPTNLHVNKALFPEDTIQSRLPDPQWLERWLGEQIGFDAVWEKKVVDMILLNLSRMFDRPIRSLRELSAFRRQLRDEAAA